LTGARTPTGVACRNNLQAGSYRQRMTDSRQNIDDKILKERIDQLYKRSKTAILTLFAVSSVYTLLLVDKFPRKHLISWYLVLILILSGRWVSAFLYSKVRETRITMRFWLYLFRFGILANGVIIGCLNLFFFPHDSLTYLLLAIILPVGVTAGAVTMLIDFFSFATYVISLMLPVIYQAVLVDEQAYLGIAVLGIIIIVYFLRFSKEYNDNFEENLRLGYLNENLLKDLETEKNKLNNRLGRIFRDSSNEIFVADARNLDCLQVNQGAVENLGYTEEEFKRIGLLDIFTELDFHSFSEMVAPLHRGEMETVAYKGLGRRKDGTTYPVDARMQLSNEDTPPIIVVIAQDITERKEWEEKLIFQANFDQLTGLVNRHYMHSHMSSAIIRARRNQQKMALLFVDLDNFKTINDTLGHYAGDEVLRQSAMRIRALLRESDTPARTGGDEFSILLEGLEKNDHAEVVALKLLEVFRQPFLLEAQEVHTTVSIGISIYPDDGKSLDQLMQFADIAMYRVKEEGRNNYRFFSYEMHRFSEEQMLITNHLRYALSKNEFYLVFQPKVDTAQNRVVGAEALLRWNNHELGNVTPDVFIPLAEKMGFINDIGTWVLEEACAEALRWKQQYRDPVQMSVNVSPQQFRTGALLEAVENALQKSGLPRELLELEITESLLMQDSTQPLVLLETLHSKGISLALDDFGTGYSSLSYLRRFPLKVLKIDRVFIRDLEGNSNNRALVEAIIAMAHSLDLDIVAEGVENTEQLDFLSRRGVSVIQGFLFSPAVPSEKFRTILADPASIMNLSQ
jgi:diguanylate cyclase (GGDEF)-like protein/PAS domain S-box-containing protein